MTAMHEIPCKKFFSDSLSVLKSGQACCAAWRRIEDLSFYTAEV
jgi:hypothetical protein